MRTNVGLILAIIEYFTELLYTAVEKHNERAKEIGERITILQAERTDNLNEARRAKAVADKIADLIS